jgi:ectoine hydroxylase-related dioxygenase (phytanoyl-CoA dioxygenase family)
MVGKSISEPKIAPKGFTKAQMREFAERGIVVIENAISPDDIQRYLAALERVQANQPCLSDRDLKIYAPSPGELSAGRDPSKAFCHFTGLVGLDPDLEELIDHERHIGFIHDIYGELTKLHISEAFIRPDSNGRNPWHVDGPRMVPFTAFSPALPLSIRVGYSLTDTPKPSMGNLVIVPGSHRNPYFAAADSWESVPGAEVLSGKAGSIGIMSGSLWHMVSENTSGVTRKNFSIGYCPSWVTPADEICRNPDSEWVKGLPRERRIVLRAYRHPYDFSKPPAEDTPLYLERPGDPYPERFAYPDTVSFHRRKHPTLLERFLASPDAPK